MHFFVTSDEDHTGTCWAYTYGYDQLDQCSLFGCVWESKIDDNETAPTVWDGEDIITSNTQDWKLVSGDDEVWVMNKDKPATSEQYPFNGMGRVRLQKNLVEVEEGGVTVTKNILYQDDFYKDGPNNTRVPNTNTVFEVPYDFELDDDIEIPANSVLEFDGGSFSNGKLISDGDFQIISDRKCLSNITFGGKCVSNFVPKLIWFIKEYPTGTTDNTIDNTSEVIQCMTCGTHNVEFPTDKFIRITQTIELDYQVNILTDKKTDISKDPYAGSNLAMQEEFVQPCIFSNNVVTIFHYKSNVVSEDNDYAFPLVIGNVNIFVNVPYNELTQTSTKVPIIKINTSVGRSQKGMDINCNIRSKIYNVTVPIADRVNPNVTTKPGYNYTGIDIYAENQGLTDVNIRGNICGVFCGARITKNEEVSTTWITNVASYAFYESCYGMIASASISIYGKHSAAMRIPTALRDYEGFFVGSRVSVFQSISDINNAKDTTVTWYCASTEGQTTSNYATRVKNSIAKNIEGDAATFASFDNAFGDYIKIRDTFAGGRDIRHFSNLLLDGIGNKHFIKNLSYKIRLENESELVESLNTDRIINSDNIFNDKVEWFKAGSFPFQTKTAYAISRWNEIEVSFDLYSHDTFGINEYFYLLIGYFSASENVNCDVEVSTSSNATNYSHAFSISPTSTRRNNGHLKIPLYNKQLDKYIKIVITFNSRAVQLPYICIPSPYYIENPAFYPTASLPKLSEYRKGIRVLNTTIGKNVTWNGTKWIEEDGAVAGVARSGFFADKPDAVDIYVGFKYFCTDRKVDMDSSSPTYMQIITPVSPDTGGMEIIHKGNGVWVDALGRVVS